MNTHRSLVGALLAALTLVTAQNALAANCPMVAARIDGDSMSRYAEDKDVIVLEKAPCRTPAKGDLVVFVHNDRMPSLKRIVAVGGDTVGQAAGILTVNGEHVKSLDGVNEVRLFAPAPPSQSEDWHARQKHMKISGVVPEGKFVVAGDPLPNKPTQSALPAYYGYVDPSQIIAVATPEAAKEWGAQLKAARASAQ